MSETFTYTTEADFRTGTLNKTTTWQELQGSILDNSSVYMAPDPSSSLQLSQLSSDTSVLLGKSFGQFGYEGQTFEVPLRTIAHSCEIFVASQVGTVHAKAAIYSVSGGLPDTLLCEGSYTSLSLGSNTLQLFSGGTPTRYVLEPGTTYALVLSPDTSYTGNVYINLSTTNPYPNGTRLIKNEPPGGWTAFPGEDLWFKIFGSNFDDQGNWTTPVINKPVATVEQINLTYSRGDTWRFMWIRILDESDVEIAIRMTPVISGGSFISLSPNDFTPSLNTIDEKPFKVEIRFYSSIAAPQTDTFKFEILDVQVSGADDIITTTGQFDAGTLGNTGTPTNYVNVADNAVFPATLGGASALMESSTFINSSDYIGVLATVKHRLGQSFYVGGADGFWIDYVEIDVPNSPASTFPIDVMCELWEMTSPSWTLITSETITVSGFGIQTFTFSPRPFIYKSNPDDYIITFRTVPESNGSYVYISKQDPVGGSPYPRGDLWEYVATGPWAINTNADMYFDIYGFSVTGTSWFRSDVRALPYGYRVEDVVFHTDNSDADHYFGYSVVNGIRMWRHDLPGTPAGQMASEHHGNPITLNYTDFTWSSTPSFMIDYENGFRFETYLRSDTSGVDVPYPILEAIEFFWDFRSPKVVPPTTPSSGEINVSKATEIIVDFDEPMDTSPDWLTNGWFDIAGGAVPSGSISWPTTSQLKFTPDPGQFFVASTVYTVTISANATDNELEKFPLDGNDDDAWVGSPTDDYVFSFTTRTLNYPTVTVHSPNYSGTPLNVDVSVTFSEPMDQSSVEPKFKLFKDAYPAGAEVTLTGKTWTVGDTVLTATPIADLDPSTDYYIVVEAGALDKENEALQADFSGFFRTKDPAPPRITSGSDPLHDPTGASPIDQRADIELKFTEAMDESSAESAFRLYETGGPPTHVRGSLISAGSFSWAEVSTRMIFDPTSNLNYNTWHEIVLLDSAEDPEGENLDGDFPGYDYPPNYYPSGDTPPGTQGGDFDSCYFLTRTETRPSVVLPTIPADLETGVDIDIPYIEITFDEAVDPASVIINTSLTITPALPGGAPNVSWHSGNTILRIDPAIYLLNSQSYLVELEDTILDDQGDQLNAYSFAFITAPPPPEVLSVTPDTVPITVEPTFTIVFSKDMDQPSTNGAIDVRKKSDSANIPVNSFAWNTMQELEIDLTPTLEYSTEYIIRIVATAESTDGEFLDGNGDGLPGGTYEYEFATTGAPPYVVSIDPHNGETNVDRNADIIIEFSNDMDMDSVRDNLYINDVLSTTVGTFSTVDSKTAKLEVFDPPGYSYSTEYQVKILETAQDSGGLYLDGNHDGVAGTNFLSYFTVQNPEKPRVVLTDPYDGEEGVEDTRLIVIRFSETMDQATTEAAITIVKLPATPAVIDHFTWLSPREVEVTPDSNWDYDVTYQVTVASTAEDLQGETMATDHVFTFITTTRPVDVQLTLPTRWPQYSDIVSEFTLSASGVTLHAMKQLSVALLDQKTNDWRTLMDLSVEAEIITQTTMDGTPEDVGRGAGGIYAGVGEKFKYTGNYFYYLRKIEAYMTAKVGSGGGEIRIDFYTGDPESNPILASSDPITPTDPDIGTWLTFTFSTPVSIQKNTSNYFLIRPTASLGISNGWSFGVSAGDVLADANLGLSQYDSGLVLTNYSDIGGQDLAFKVHGTLAEDEGFGSIGPLAFTIPAALAYGSMKFRITYGIEEDDGYSEYEIYRDGPFFAFQQSELPQVSAFSYNDGLDTLTITFSKEMNQATVEQYIQFTGGLQPSFIWTDAYTVEITFGNLVEDVDYTVTLISTGYGAAVSDTDNLPLAGDSVVSEIEPHNYVNTFTG